MNVKKNDLYFLLFYAPLFFVKLLTFDAGSFILKIVAIICFGFFILYMLSSKRYKLKEFVFFVIGGTYLSLLVITCGKEGALFSFISIILMRYTNRLRNRSILFYIGIIGVLLCLYLTRNTREAIRYIDGAWVSMTKRSNIAFISFFSVMNLFLITYKDTKNKTLFILALLSYLIYKYTGCRTGILCAMVLIGLLVALRSNRVARMKTVKIALMSCPTICMLISIVMVYAFDSGEKWAIFLNHLVQGRIKQGSMFMRIYEPKLFGQKLVENFSSSSFFVLDSAYLDMLLCYGILFSIIWVVMSTFVINWMYKKHNYIGVAVVVSFAVFGITETFLPNCFLNSSLFLYGEYIMDKYKLGIDNSQPIKLISNKK